ncbi:MAG: RNB domain-containing ribonuclease, partial [Bacteroidota bacterium]
MSKRKKKPKKDFNPKYLKSDILKLFKRSAKKRYHGRQIIKKLKLQGVSLPTVDAHLESLAKEGHILLLSNGKYRLNKTAPAAAGDFAIGRVDMTQRGTAFIIVEDLDTDIYIGSRHLNSALHGDTVKVRYSEAQNGRRPEGKIIEVLERATDHFIGEINISASFAFVIPDSNRMPVDIFVPLEHKGEAKNGDKVVVKVVSWHGPKNRSPIGQVTAVLGKPGSSDIEMKAILIGAGFELEFPEAVLEETNQLSDELTEAEIQSRRDFRDVTTITIDPKTAKDFDDALSIQRLDNGNVEIGVHIADVTHYVKEGSELDKEAYNRSTSVYLVDRVLPMLPEKLSNEYCSLRPKEQSACFSAVFEFDNEFKVVNRWFGKTLIFSDHRFAYEEAQEVLDAGEGLYAEELGLMNRIAHALRKDRFKKGSISFESPEVQFEL